ncbi:MAG: hypothetical protein QG577_2534, partial [Thermodesulfobacteriota bacterium]|nr:hypothetical protein [Thermodesulfobacteriota bacterium]
RQKRSLLQSRPLDPREGVDAIATIFVFCDSGRFPEGKIHVENGASLNFTDVGHLFLARYFTV